MLKLAEAKYIFVIMHWKVARIKTNAMFTCVCHLLHVEFYWKSLATTETG